MANVYHWKKAVPIFGGGRKVDPQIVGEELEKIGGPDLNLTPQQIADAARSSNILNRFFEWDDAKNGEVRRRDQARALLEALKVVRIVDDHPIEVPAFVSLPANGDEHRGYRMIATVENNASLQRQLIDQAIRDLRAYERRYAILTSVCKLLGPAFRALTKAQAEAAKAAKATTKLERKKAKGAKGAAAQPGA